MFSGAFLLQGVVAPAVAAFVVALLVQRVFHGSRGVGAAGYAVGQALGTVLLIDVAGEWAPSRNLQWVPWMGVAAAAIGPTVVATGLAAVERWILTVFAATVAAVVLVPRWPDLWPPRLISLILFVLAASTVARLTEGVAQRTSPRLMVLSIAGVSLLAAILIAASFSLSVGEAALTTAAALTGTAAALSCRPDETAVRGLCLPYVLVVGGWCYVTAIEPSPPLVAFLFLPASLLVFWLAAVGPLSRWTARRRLIACVLFLLTYLAGISAWAWSTTAHGN